MTDLITRLESAEGAEDILFSTREEFAEIFRAQGVNEFPLDWPRSDDGHKLSVFHLAFSSLDAALTLAGEVLPEWDVSLYIECRGNGTNAAMYCGDSNRPDFKATEEVTHGSSAIAVLIALLQAQGAQE